MPFQNPGVRWAIAVADAILIAAIAYFLLEDTAQTVAYGVALVTLVTLPWFLKRAAEN